MWRIWNKLFGWEYVIFEFGYGFYITRAHKLPCGKKYVLVCGKLQILNDGREYYYLTDQK